MVSFVLVWVEVQSMGLSTLYLYAVDLTAPLCLISTLLVPSLPSTPDQRKMQTPSPEN